MTGIQVEEAGCVDFTGFTGNNALHNVPYANHNRHGDWIVDSGATSHMCSNKTTLHNIFYPSLLSSVFLFDGSI